MFQSYYSNLFSNPILVLIVSSLLLDKLSEVSVVRLYNREENLEAPSPSEYDRENVKIISLSSQSIADNFTNSRIGDKPWLLNQQFIRTLHHQNCDLSK